MKRAFFTIFVVLCLMVGVMNTPVFAANSETPSKIGVYVEPKIGMSMNLGQYLDTNGISRNSTATSNTSLNGALSVGYDWYHQFNLPLRTEVEYGIRTTTHFDVHGRDVKAYHPQTLLGNVYWDFRNSSDFTPYIGAGAGMAFIGPKSNFAWNAGTGVSYAINTDWSVNLGYRFMSLGQFEQNHTKGLLYSHDVNLGLRYTF